MGPKEDQAARGLPHDQKLPRKECPTRRGHQVGTVRSKEAEDEGAIDQAKGQGRRRLQEKKGEKEKSQVSATSARSVFPANPSQLKQFLENKDLNFKEKLISLKKETSETKREALAQPRKQTRRFRLGVLIFNFQPPMN
jgi:hypothetical protein